MVAHTHTKCSMLTCELEGDVTSDVDVGADLVPLKDSELRTKFEIS